MSKLAYEYTTDAVSQAGNRCKNLPQLSVFGLVTADVYCSNVDRTAELIGYTGNTCSTEVARGSGPGTGAACIEIKGSSAFSPRIWAKIQCQAGENGAASAGNTISIIAIMAAAIMGMIANRGL